MKESTSMLRTVKNGISGFFAAIAGFFADFGAAVAKGDLFVKLSLLWMGAGYMRRRQYVKAVLMTVLEIAVIAFTLNFSLQYVSKFGTLGTVQMEQVFNPQTMKTEWNDYDNSFLILLFSLFSFVIWFAALVVWMQNVINAYRLQLEAESGRHINSFREDLRTYTGEKFHITLLALPVLGIIVFTVIPILLLIFVAFTNYDQQHMPPNALFTWVGFDNFISLFSSGGMTVTFGYAFVRVLGWTLVWAAFATFTTYIGGILLSLLLNNKRTKGKKFWRLMFIITIAVPQFVSLLLVRNFFSNGGIVNTICANIGLTLVYAASSGLGYLICKGFFDTVPRALCEAARLDGCSEARIFWQIIIPTSKPIIVYTVINSFLTPWMDFVYSKMILNAGVSANYTVAVGLYKMLEKSLINNYFTLFCCGGVLVSIPISILFLIMQKFYVEGITAGAVKG